MADANAVELMRMSSSMFSKKSQLDALHQVVAEECYPERANFTIDRALGTEWAEMLITSYPAQMRRDLAQAMGAITRPKSQQWFSINVAEQMRTDAAKWWLDKATDRQRALLYNVRAGFQRAIQVTDDDVIAFGNAIISHVESRERDGLVVYDAYHPKDCAWIDDDQRNVIRLDRKFRVKLCNWEKVFGKPLPECYRTIREKEPYHKVCIVQVVLPFDHYDAYNKKRMNKKYRRASVYVDRDKQTIISEGGYVSFPYTVRRWRLDSCSQYGYSPAATLGLVESRLLQSQTKVVLDAGERAVDPPMIATRDAVLGQVSTYAGGTTWIDGDYDEKLGAALRPLDTGANAPLGLEFIQDTRAVLQAAWYINKLTLPNDNEMTAFEAQERVGEYIRSIGPVAEPFQDDNARILDASFEKNLELGNMGPLEAIPPEIAGADVQFEFDGPLQMAYKRIKMMQGRETFENALLMSEKLAAIRHPAAHDVVDNFDLDAFTRDMAGYSYGDRWLKPMEEILASREQKQAQQQAMVDQQTQAQEIANASAVADIVPKVDVANQSIKNIAAGAANENAAGGDEFPDLGDEDVEEQAVAAY